MTDPGTLHRMAIELATGAAEVVRSGRLRVTGGSDAARPVSAAAVEHKSTATDLVTEVDQETERWLAAEIARLRPGDEVLGEEGGPQRAVGPGTGVRWVLDPIDGTVNFVLGIPIYSVSVAAELDGQVVAGAVCNPASGELFHAALGGGAHQRVDGVDRPLPGPRDIPLARAVVATGFGYDAARRARQIAVVAPLLPRIGDIRRLGGAALDLCFVAAGRVDAYFEAGLNLWDYAAGGLIAAETGCVLSGLRGRPASQEFLAVAGPQLASEFFDVLTELGADAVCVDEAAADS